MNILTTKTIKVFYPSLGKIVNKRAHIIKMNRLTELAVLVEDVSKYGQEPTQAHNALIDDGLGVFHFSGWLYSAINKFDELTHEKILEYQSKLQLMTKGISNN
jgi:hypothetical protein